MRVPYDPRVHQMVQMVNQLEDAARVIPRWKNQAAGGPSGSGPGSTVLVNVSGLDLAREIHSVLVTWCEEIAEKRGVQPPDVALSTWHCTPGGTWIATGGNTSAIAMWLRQQSSWVVEQTWYIDAMWPELIELRRKVRGLMGLWQTPKAMRDLVVELASSGGSIEEMREVARARRANA